MTQPVGADGRAGPLDASLTSPVGWLVGADFERKATCFLVADWWIATARHAVQELVDAADRVAIFNFREGGDPAARDGYALAPEDGGFVVVAQADVAFVRLLRRPGATAPGVLWGRIHLDTAHTPAIDTPVYCVQQWLRDGCHMKSYTSGTVQGLQDPWVLHNAPAHDGSSGAPLFDDGGAWLGVHTGTTQGLWRAARSTLVVDALRARELPADLLDALGQPA